jgi:small GTP-binding protein
MDLCEIKLVLVGNTNVGKTSIVKTAITGSFTDESASTLGASYSTKTFQIDSRTIRLQIWDTAGQEKYRGMTPMYYHNAQIAIVVYSIAERETFEAVDFWLKSLKDNADADIIVFIVGNKTDLIEKRQIATEEGAEKARKFGTEFAEVSAKTGFGIGDLFASIPQIFLERKPRRTHATQGKSNVVRETDQIEGKDCC